MNVGSPQHPDLDALLRESEERYLSVFDRTPAPMWIFDVETLGILAVNDAALERYGWTREEFLTLTLRDLRPPGEQWPLWRARTAMLAGHEVHSVFRHWTRRREPFDVEVRTRSLPGADGRLRLALALDVSEHRRVADVARYLDHASGIFAASLDRRLICRSLASLATIRLGDWCAVHWAGTDGRATLCGLAHANPLDEPRVAEMARSRDVAGHDHPVAVVLRTGRPLILPPGDHGATVRGTARARAVPSESDAIDWRLGARAALYLPIRGQGRLLGVLECVTVSDDRAPAPADIALGEELASRAGLALDNALAHEEARRTRPSAAPAPLQSPAASDATPDAADAQPLMSVLEHITDGFISVGTDWQITYVNREGERILGGLREEMVGRSFWQVFPNAVGTRFGVEYRRAMEVQRSAEFEAYYDEHDAWYGVRVHPSPHGLGIFFRETTAVHQAEERRREGERVLFEHLELASDLVHVAAPDGRMLFANRAWRDVLGYTLAELRSLTIFDVIAPESHAIAHAALERVLAGEPVRDVELEVVARDGRRLRVAGGGGCRFEHGQPASLFGIFRDVTAVREAEAALRDARRAALAATRAREEFLSRMNQELRTPLTAIIGFARLLERDVEGRLSAEQLDFARRISSQGHDLLATLEDVIAYAELEGRRVELDIAPVPIDATVRAVIGELEGPSAARGVRLVADLPSAPAPAHTDAGRVRQLLRHVLDEATRCATPGEVVVTLDVEPGTRRPTRIRVRGTPDVEGAGEGNGRHGGAGLGMTIARSLAQLLGIELRIDLAPHGGIEAAIELPEELPTEAAPGPARATDPQLATLLHAVVNASPLAVIVYDTQTVVRLWNEAATRLFGWTAAEAIGRPNPTVPEDELPRLRELMRRAVETGGVTDAPVRRRTRDGRVVEAHVSVAPLRDAEGRLMGFVSLLADVTERNRLEAQLHQAQRMEVVGRLAGGIAHDFNNLLTVIRAYADFLKEETPPGSPLQADIDSVRQAADRAVALTRQLLAFSRKQVIDPQVLRLSDVVRDVEPMLRRLIGEHIAVTVLAKAEGCVLADAGQLEQVLMNLAVNARDAMPDGGVLLLETSDQELDDAYAAAHPEVRPGAYVCLTVTDTGHGMDAETLAHVFEPFFTTKEPGKGTGLGLATVYGIVKQAGGYVWVYSEPQHGTAFKVFLPRTNAEPVAPTPMVVEDLRGTETVLLVEDEAAVRAVARRILEGYGYRVVEARHGADALALAEVHDEPIHLLITDVVMPEMGGRELAERFARLRPDTRVLFVSGYTDDAVLQRNLARGGAMLLGKPFSSEALGRAVRAALESR